MRYTRSQSGFTMVELIIVLAITSLMIAGAMVGQSNLRQQASKTAAVDNIKNQLEKIRSEATSTIATGNGNSGQSVFGKLVEFDPTQPGRMTISTLIADDDDPTGKLSRCETTQIPFANNMRYTKVDGVAAKSALIFVRKNNSNPDQVYVAPPNYTDTPAGPLASCTGLAVYNPPLVVGSPTPPPPPPGPPPPVDNGCDNVCIDQPMNLENIAVVHKTHLVNARFGIPWRTGWNCVQVQKVGGSGNGSCSSSGISADGYSVYNGFFNFGTGQYTITVQKTGPSGNPVFVSDSIVVNVTSWTP